MKNIKLILILLSLPLLSLKCNKKDDAPYTRLSDEFLAYTYFETGSWWAYKELSSGLVDTERVVYHYFGKNYKDDFRGGTPEHVDEFSMQMVREIVAGSRDTTLLRGFPAGDLGDETAYIDGNRINVFFEINYKYTISTDLFFSPVISGVSILQEQVEIIKIFDSLEVNDVFYEDVVVTNHNINPNSETSHYIKSEYYAKGVGVIRREYVDGRVKELIDYSIHK